jgi:hypothetical protein
VRIREEAMISPIIRSAYRYGQTKCEGSHLPRRRDIDPIDIPKVLPHVSLVERDPDSGRMWYRLIGTALVDCLGFDCTGRYLDEVYPEFNASPSKHFRDDVFRTGQPSHRLGHPSIRFAQDFAAIERLYLPLASDRVHVNVVMGVIVHSLDLVDD